MQMANKKYAEYSQELHIQYLKFIQLDTIEARKVINQIKKVAEKTGSMEWQLWKNCFELFMFKIEHNDNKYSVEELLSKLIL